MYFFFFDTSYNICMLRRNKTYYIVYFIIFSLI